MKLRANPLPESGHISIGSEVVSFTVFRSRKRKRTIAFYMEKDTSLRVLAPASTSLGALTKILHERTAWILAQMAQHKAPNAQEERYVDGSSFLYLGHACKLKVTQGAHAPQSCTLLPHSLQVHVPETNLSSESLREEVRLEITLWLKKRARAKLKKRMDIWAAQMGVDYKKMIVTDPERRWGSCSVDNIIRLNWRLMMAPLPVLDYVVVHELAHIRHKNHSARFWNFVGKAMPDFQARRKALRQVEGRILN